MSEQVEERRSLVVTLRFRTFVASGWMVRAMPNKHSKGAQARVPVPLKGCRNWLAGGVGKWRTRFGPAVE